MSSIRFYATITALLLGLLLATIAVAFIDLGPLNTVASMTISAAKAGLILLFFMHVRGSAPVVRIYAMAGFFWLVLMMALVFSDYLSR